MTSTTFRAPLLAVALAVVTSRGARAQVPPAPPPDLVGRAVRAYQNLEFDAAAGLLRRALTRPVVDSLSLSERAQALTYLAAAERFRERRDSATAAFRRLVLLDPRYRPDPLIFPPEVTRMFDEVRGRTKTVVPRVPADTEFRLSDGRLVAWLLASSPHDVVVEVAREDGRPFRTLYAGPIGDSLEVRWDARDSTGALAPAGRLMLRVTSRSGAGGPTTRIVQLPLEVAMAQVDTLPHPPPLSGAMLLPETASRGMAMRALSGGLLLGAGAVVLPSIIAPGGKGGPSGTRWAVAGALSLSGVIGYLSQPAGRPLPANVAVNRERRDEWRRRLETVKQQNAARLRDARVRIRVGQSVAIDRERA